MKRATGLAASPSPAHGERSPGQPPDAESGPRGLERFLGAFRYTGRAIELVWTTSPRITVGLGLLSLVLGLLPGLIAVVGRHIVDAVVLAAGEGGAAAMAARDRALAFVGLELGLIASLAAAQRGLSVCESLLRALLGQRVNEMILEKALTLSLADFEDSEFYDRMTRARREASSRPLALVRRTASLVQNGISLLAYGAILLQLSAWAVLGLALAAIPVFVAETRFAQDAFRLFRWRAPEARQQTYLETLLAREDHAKEVTLFRLGPLFLGRYREIFEKLYGEDRALTLRRGFWGFVLGLLSTLAFYAAYAWIVIRAAVRAITLGDMTMYLLVFKQGQGALSSILTSISGAYEDNLYLSNLYEYLAHPSVLPSGGATLGRDPDDGIRFEAVSFRYPGAVAPALRDVTLHVPPGSKLALVGENGAGKTTLIKLLTRLYEPTSGRVTLDGTDLRDWDPVAVRKRIGVIFQDFIRYQLLVGENVGAGDVDAFQDEARWKRASELGMAAPFVERLEQGYQTQLGRWFKGGQELSVGQWQKIALSRAFMSEQADILVLDEPTAAMDAEAEAEVFQRFRALTDRRMGIVISHRFSTVRMADRIVVLEHGAVVEQGTHDELLVKAGRYARLFNLQAEGYR